MADQLTGVLVAEITDQLTPTLAEVGALLRTRTRSDETGDTVGTFTENTQPTAAEVVEYIDLAQDEVTLKLPDTLPAKLVSYTRSLIATRTAMTIELSYDTDRTDAESPAYDRLERLYDSRLATLMEAVKDAGIGDTARRFVSMTLVSPYSGPVVDDETDLSL